MNVLMIHESRSRQTALYSFCGAIGVCLMVFASWWLMRPDTPAIPRQRRLTDLDITWRCPNGHEFVRQGSHRPVQCPQCNRHGDVTATYACREHGAKRALIRYSIADDGREIISQVSFRPMVWRRVNGAVRCPECGSAVSPKTSNPFATTRRPAGPGASESR